MYQNRELKSAPIRVSVIIPTLNESANIVNLIDWLNTNDDRLEEIIVVDGGSEDDTISLVKGKGMEVITSAASRAIQMNAGAKKARGNVLYFIHADTLPPKTYLEDINEAIKDGFYHGCYQSKFDSSSLQLRLNAFFTRFNYLICRGGDQSLFVEKSFFKSTKGFDESKLIMEEYDWLRSAKKKSKLRIIPKGCLISTRKYDKNSYFRINIVNFYVFVLFYFNYPSHKLASMYKRLLN